ncbi:DUF411 domain-containing protein [Variovorax sp. HJSM1_2]|uniref:DUF411 domain-containing protein n=1 Tax=Variovorax sp. HJSM1_2 TaxID=3366263 RepID=UPI003BE077EF
MKRRQLLSAACIAGTSLSPRAKPSLPQIHVYKNAGCACCAAWVDHLKAAGFATKVTEVVNTTDTRKQYGLPEKFGSCHTALVNGYLVEGHVPAAEVKRLLALKPTAIGIAVPGMPIGSPGMEVDDRQESYEVLLIDKRGGATVFARYPQPSRTMP